MSAWMMRVCYLLAMMLGVYVSFDTESVLMGIATYTVITIAGASALHWYYRERG